MRDILIGFIVRTNRGCIRTWVRQLESTICALLNGEVFVADQIVFTGQDILKLIRSADGANGDGFQRRKCGLMKNGLATNTSIRCQAV
jgi:hypothetical protein